MAQLLNTAISGYLKVIYNSKIIQLNTSGTNCRNIYDWN
jgi:hypothetical protein